MPRDQAKPNIKNNLRQPPIPKDQGKQPRKQTHEVQAPLSPPASNILEGRKAPQRPQTLHRASTSSRERKRGREEQAAGSSSSRTQEQLPLKRLQTLPSSCPDKKKSHQVLTSDVSEDIDPVQHWIKTEGWPKECFEQDSQVREDFERGKLPEEPAQSDLLQEHYTGEPVPKMNHFTRSQNIHAKKKSSASLRRKQSQSTLQTSSDQPSRESKSSQYNTSVYEAKLNEKGSYMSDHNDFENSDAKWENMRSVCKTLLEKNQTVPQDSLFRDDLFKKICEKIRTRNEAIVVQDITRLIAPSAQNLAIYGAKHLNILYETVNEAWGSMIEYEGTLPQPDYSVGFGRSTFSQEQLDKLIPFVGELGSKVTTYFMATTWMYFPFFTCEVKCGAVALDVADRQNAQSMSVALRALVILFRYVKREKELDKEILSFSISHDHRSVRIYGHYPVIEGDQIEFYRHPIRSFDITDGVEKWTAFKFVKNVYDEHSPKLKQLICSAIDDMPAGINFDPSQSPSLSQSTP